MQERSYSLLDRVITSLDVAIATVFSSPAGTGRANPSRYCAASDLSTEDRLRSSRLMRVNHAGEVAAQALYQGQAVTARQDSVRAAMEKAALEENDHLAWCAQRIHELSGHPSYLNPAWYAGSFAIGVLAGLAGDAWSLGFVVETEHQVVRHLDNHLRQLPESDLKSRAILEQMRQDESHHATAALESGGNELPDEIRILMSLASQVMIRTAYWI